jgi:hypothetical protein
LTTKKSEKENIFGLAQIQMPRKDRIDKVDSRDSFQKYNFFSGIPSQLASPVTAPTVKLGSVPTNCQATGSPCGCQPKRRSLLQDGAPKGRSASQQRDLAASQTHGMLGALVDRSDNLLTKAAADVDEIDMASSDTFLPWSPEFFEADPLL